MATSVATTLLPGSAGRRLFTVSEYALMAEKGVFKPEERTELLGGEVRLMSPVGPMHAEVVNRLNKTVILQCGDDAYVSGQNPLRLDDYSVPQPDLVICRIKGGGYKSGPPTPNDVLLVVEVSDSTIRLDREEKLPRYAAARISEAWIIDVEAQQIEQYSEPSQGVYEKKVVRKIDDEIRSLGSPTIVIQVGKLFA